VIVQRLHLSRVVTTEDADLECLLQAGVGDRTIGQWAIVCYQSIWGALRTLRQESHAGRAVVGCCITMYHMSDEGSGCLVRRLSRAVTAEGHRHIWCLLLRLALEVKSICCSPRAVYDVSHGCVIVTGCPSRTGGHSPGTRPGELFRH
jgi:hypothetical protein